MVRITQLFGLTAFLLLVSTSADGLDLETALAERVLETNIGAKGWPCRSSGHKHRGMSVR